jgi:nitrous oxidase accessory protein NosD
MIRPFPAPRWGVVRLRLPLVALTGLLLACSGLTLAPVLAQTPINTLEAPKYTIAVVPFRVTDLTGKASDKLGQAFASEFEVPLFRAGRFKLVVRDLAAINQVLSEVALNQGGLTSESSKKLALLNLDIIVTGDIAVGGGGWRISYKAYDAKSGEIRDLQAVTVKNELDFAVAAEQIIVGLVKVFPLRANIIAPRDGNKQQFYINVGRSSNLLVGQTGTVLKANKDGITEGLRGFKVIELAAESNQAVIELDSGSYEPQRGDVLELASSNTALLPINPQPPTPQPPTPQPPTPPTLGTPKVSFSVGPINIDGKSSAIIVVYFRDPAGQSYPSSGVPVRLNISGPTGFGNPVLIERTDYDFIWTFPNNTKAVAGNYQLEGTINGQKVRSSITLAGSGELSSTVALPVLSVNSDSLGQNLGASWGNSNSSKLYSLTLRLDSDNGVVDSWLGSNTSYSFRPQTPYAPDRDYYFRLVALDVPEIDTAPGVVPARINAAMAFSKTFRPAQSNTVVAAPTINVKTAAELEQAITTAVAGSTIRLAAGEYRLNKTIEIGRNLSLIGLGRDQSKITGSSKGFVIKVNSATVRLQGVSFEHAGFETADVMMSYNSKLTIKDCRFFGAVTDGKGENGGDGLWLTGNSEADIQASEFIGNELQGLELQDNSKATVVGGLSSDNRKAGIFMRGDSSLALQEFRLESNDVGLQAQDNSKIELSNNQIIKNTTSGLAINDKVSGFVRDNNVDGNGASGIFLTNTTNLVIERNILANNNSYGLRMLDQSQQQFTSNTLLASNTFRNNSKGAVQDERK